MRQFSDVMHNILTSTVEIPSHYKKEEIARYRYTQCKYAASL